MDTVEELYKKYIDSLQSDIQRGCSNPTIRTQSLLAFYQEVLYRLSDAVGDQVTANQLLTYTHNNYE